MPQKQDWKHDTKVRYSVSAWNINQAFYYDSFNSMVVEGLQRSGKTSYVVKSFANAFGEWEFKPYRHVVKPDFEEVKNWLTFMPKEYLNVIMDLKEKVRGIILDDAGLWLYALDWYDPFVKAVNKWLQVCGTRFGSVFLTTPDKSLISSKILDALPQMKVCRIEKAGIDRLKHRPRLAKVYEKWNYPDGKKGGVKHLYSDRFNAILPDDFFNWYQPKREGYVELALQLLNSEIVKIDKRLATEGKQLTQDAAVKIAEKDGTMDLIDRYVGNQDKLVELDEVFKMLKSEKDEKQKKVLP